MLLDLLGPPGLADVAVFHFSDIPVRGDAGARAIGANDDAAAVEPPGSTPPTPRIESRVDWGLRRALSPTFPAGEMVFFIPWRVVAENPARRILASRRDAARPARAGAAAADATSPIPL